MSLRAVLITAAVVIVILIIGALLTRSGHNPLDMLATPGAPAAAPPTPPAGG